MPTVTQEILDKALKDVAALACADKPNLRAIKAGLLRCIVAADCVEIDNELIVRMLTERSNAEVRDFSERLTRSNERVHLLLQERGSVTRLLFTIHTQAEQALSANLDAMSVKEYNAAQYVSHFADVLRGIGAGAKALYDSYNPDAGVQETSGRIC